MVKFSFSFWLFIHQGFAVLCGPTVTKIDVKNNVFEFSFISLPSLKR